MRHEDITLLLGVDAEHLRELRAVWPDWMRLKPELRAMPCVVFYDTDQVRQAELDFLKQHPSVRLVAWGMPRARSQREKMLSGFVYVAAREVRTPWYLKIDTDVVATAAGEWIRPEWFAINEKGELPVFISQSWGYSKPRYVMDLLDDWGDSVPLLAARPRLNLPYSSGSRRVRHPRVISWLFFGRTDWTREMAALTEKEGRLPFPSQDSFLFYCAARQGRRYVRAQMNDLGWKHERPSRLLAKTAPAATMTPPGIRGVVYYNLGTGCVVRMLVSLVSLRKHYAGPVSILSEGEESHALCRRIGAALGINVIEWASPVPPGRHRGYLAKTCYHSGSPYQTTVALDADTLVLGPIDELFELAEKHTFCVAQLSNWRSRGRIISKRIRQWEDLLPDFMQKALDFGPAINCGVVAFQKDAPLCQDWMRYALLGRDCFIPDEVCCQIILHRYPHHILDTRWNRSCRHDNPDLPDTRIIHYHGRKHCRPALPFHGDKWLAAFLDVHAKNVAGVRDWMPAGDRLLQKYLRANPIQGLVVGSGRDVTRSVERTKLCVVLGAGKTVYPGWLSTERPVLDVTQEEDFRRFLGGGAADRFLAEHVWEHLGDEALRTANALTFKYLKPGGCLRIAVPDGSHPDPKYIEGVKPNGTGRSADDHKQLFTHVTLSAWLESAGFVVDKLEYWDEAGKFHQKPWKSDDGHIKRSTRHDRRNRQQPFSYTSLIVDAHKPRNNEEISPRMSVPRAAKPLVYETDLWCKRGHLNKDQADKYAEICQQLQPRHVLETGFCTGRSAACVLHYSDAVARMVSIDINLDFKAPHGRKMAGLLQKRFPAWQVIEDSSRMVLNSDFFSREFPQGIDLATIDGDHTYEGCMFDLEAVAPVLSAQGMMVIDDYRSGPPNGKRIRSVTQSVDDFLAKHGKDFVGERWNKHGKGFCIIRRVPP